MRNALCRLLLLLVPFAWPVLQRAPVAEPAELEPAWRQPVDGQIQTIALSPDGTCVGVVAWRLTDTGSVSHDQTLTAYRAGGRALWQVPLAAASAGVAVAPRCDWAAVAEDQEASDRSAAVRFVLAGALGQTVTLPSVARSMAISHKGDLLALGIDAPEGQPNIYVVARSGAVAWTLVNDSNYRHPEVEFSDDDVSLVVKACFGVGVLSRSGAVRWGGRGGNRWRRIDASRDARWFAAHEAPVHGPQGGSVGLVDARGHAVWTRGPLWEPGAVIAPNASYAVVQGAPMTDERPQLNPAITLWLVDRRGRTLATRAMGQVTLQFVSADARSVVVCEPSSTRQGSMDLFGLDTKLLPKWRMPLACASPWAADRESGLVVAGESRLLTAYVVPKG